MERVNAAHRQEWCFVLTALFVCVLIRLLSLDADPPDWLSWSSGVYTDEGFYTLDARHLILFGQPAPGNFHDRLLSPVFSVLQQGVFALFGAGLRQARLLSVAFGIATLCVFWLVLRRTFDANTALAGLLFLGLAPPSVFYNRLALQETPAVFWLTLAFALTFYGDTALNLRKRTLLLFLSGTSLGIGVVFKALAVMGGGAIAKKPFLPAQYWGLGATLFLYGVFWYAPHQGELARMTTFYRESQMQPHTWRSLGLNIGRGFVGGEHGFLPYLLATMPVTCLLALRRLARRIQESWTPADTALALWLAGGLAFCLISSYAPSRYYVLFLPALCGLAARGWSRLRPPWRTSAAVLTFAISGAWYVQFFVTRTWTRQESARALARLAPPGSLLVGEFAPALCLDTGLRAAPVQLGLSNDDHPVERLHPEYVVATRALSLQRFWNGNYPNLMTPAHRVATYRLGGARAYLVDVYRVR